MKLIVIDVDGTLTDGSIYYTENKIEIKKFNVKDAAGILAAQAVGIPCMILTGRESYAVKRRAEDLKIQYVEQGVKDKLSYLDKFINEKGIGYSDVLYIGDDLNDLSAIRKCGYTACPFDATEEIKDEVDYISINKGGYGAVRDSIFHFLKIIGKYDEAISLTYSGI